MSHLHVHGRLLVLIIAVVGLVLATDDLAANLKFKCQYFNKSISLDSHLSKYHCSRQGSRQVEVARTVLDQLGLQWPVRHTSRGPATIIQSLNGVLNGNMTIATHYTSVAPLVREAFLSADSPGLIDKHAATTLKKLIFPTAKSADDSLRTWFYLENMANNKIENATLHFMVERPATSAQSQIFKYTILMYKYITQDRISHSHEIRADKHISVGEKGAWDSVNVTRLVRDWIKAPNKNMGLLLKAKPKDESPADLLIDKKTMFLEVDLSPRKRPIALSEESLPNDCSMNSNKHNSSCCRYPLTVDFERYGWDWVISPKRYQAYYCAGDCTHDSRRQTIYSTMVNKAQRLNLANNGASMSLLMSTKTSACCSPQQILPRNIIYEDEAGNIKNQSIPGMIVVSCGCA